MGIDKEKDNTEAKVNQDKWREKYELGGDNDFPQND